jgi:hypothetical protein
VEQIQFVFGGEPPVEHCELAGMPLAPLRALPEHHQADTTRVRRPDRLGGLIHE